MNTLFTMYIGMEQTHDGRRIYKDEQTQNMQVIKAKLAEEFGGYSVGWVQGGYVAHDGKLAEERAIRAEITATNEQESKIIEIAKLFKKWFHQESILLNSTAISSNFI